MKFARWMEMAALAALAVVLTASVGVSARSEEEFVVAEPSSTMAGVSTVITGYEVSMSEENEELLSIVEQESILLAAGYVQQEEEEEEEEEEEPIPAAVDEEPEPKEEESEPVLSEEEIEWQQYLMADVDSYLNVRKSPDVNSEVVGKLYRGDRALIVAEEGEWTQITSGNVSGYVQSSYCLTGAEALSYTRANLGMTATVTSESRLRIRTQPSTGSSTYQMVTKGTELAVDLNTPKQKGWVAISISSKTYYVSADFVELSYNVGVGVTIEEEKAAEEAAKKAEEEAAKEAEKKKKAEEEAALQKAAASVSADERTLLGAIIQCEAGGESYECQLAVGSVVMNRVRSSYFPNTITNVIYSSGQFTPASNGRLAARLKSGVSATALKAADEALAGTDNTDGCLYFNDRWHTRHTGLQYGNMIFWKSW